MYSIDFLKLIKFNLPAFLWKTVALAWLTLLLSEVKSLYNTFISYKAALIYDTAHSSQVIYLEHILNDIFDRTLRRVHISDGDAAPAEMFMYNQDEDNPKYIYNSSETSAPNVYIYNKSEGNGTNGYSDFKVMVPQSLTFDMNYMKAMVLKYKILGPTFIIQTYTDGQVFND